MQSSVQTKGNVFVGGERQSWQDIDRALRSIAKRQRALDAEEAVLLCSVVRREIWRQLGKASLLEYLEDVLGYGPKAAHERVRVALALDELPVLAEALANGEQSYSAIKELTRVATAKTQAEWIDAARGKNVRQIEELVAGHKRGDRPTDAPEPDLKPQIVRFEISTATHARLRHAQQVLAEENGGQLDDDAFVAALCDAILDGNASADDGGRARYQILTTVCAKCDQAWQHGGGRDLAVSDDRPRDRGVRCATRRLGSRAWKGRAGCGAEGAPVRDAPRSQALHRSWLSRGAPHRCPSHRAAASGRWARAGEPDAVVQRSSPRVARGPPDHHRSGAGPELRVDERRHRGGRCRRRPTSRLALAPDARRGASASRTGSSRPTWGKTSVALTSIVSPPREPVRVPEPSKYDWTVKKTEVIAAMKQMGFSKEEARALVEQAIAELPRSASREQLVVRALRIYRTSAAGASLSR